jgi:hypothetical protein
MNFVSQMGSRRRRQGSGNCSPLFAMDGDGYSLSSIPRRWSVGLRLPLGWLASGFFNSALLGRRRWINAGWLWSRSANRLQSFVQWMDLLCGSTPTVGMCAKGGGSFYLRLPFPTISRTGDGFSSQVISPSPKLPLVRVLCGACQRLFLLFTSWLRHPVWRAQCMRWRVQVRVTLHSQRGPSNPLAD